MKKVLLLVLGALLFLGSCVKLQEPTPETLTKQYSFTSEIKAASRATDSGFQSGDQIGVSAFYDEFYTQSYAKNVLYEFNGTKFTSVTPIEYTINKESAFCAVYPYLSDVSGEEFVFDINCDQSSYESYTQSDLMTSRTELTTQSEPNLVFAHRLSLVTINIINTNINLDNAVAVIRSKSSVEVDVFANTYSGTGELQNIVSSDNGTNSFRAIVAPQVIAKQTQFITISSNGEDYVFTLDKDVELLSGKQYTYTAEISATNELIITATIDPWEEGEELGNGAITDENGGNGDDNQGVIDEQYNNWIGTWSLTSTASLVSGKPITVDVIIEGNDAETFNIYGWDLSTNRWKYAMPASYNSQSGRLSVAGVNKFTEKYEGEEMYYRAKCYVESPYSTYHFVGVDYTALEATMNSSGSSASVNCGVSQLSDGTSFTTATMLLCYGDGPYMFDMDESLALEDGEMLVGPFTMTKISNSTLLPQ